jgi:Tfp pilus assembly protein PilX
MAANTLMSIKNNQAGSSLVGVIALAIVMSVACLGYLQVATSTANGELTQRNDDAAFYAAESGLLLGGAWLKAQASFPTFTQNDIFSANPVTVNGNQVTVDIVVAGPLTSQTYTVRSTATSGSLRYDKVISQNAATSSTPISSPAFDYALMSGGDMTANGTVSLATDADGHRQKVQTNSNFTKNGNSGTVDVDVSASGSISDSHHKIQGTASAGAAAVAFPDIDLTPWQTNADQVLNNTTAGMMNSGVIWINSNADVTLPGSVNGTVIVNFTATNHTLTVSTNVINQYKLAVACIGGTLSISGNNTVQGLVYSKANTSGSGGNLAISGTPTLRGQGIAQGTLTVSGTPNVFLYEKSTQVIAPGSGSGGGFALVAGSWLASNIVH